MIGEELKKAPPSKFSLYIKKSISHYALKSMSLYGQLKREIYSFFSEICRCILTSIRKPHSYPLR